MKREIFYMTIAAAFIVALGCAPRPTPKNELPPSQSAVATVHTSPQLSVQPSEEPEAEMKVALPEDLTNVSFEQLWFVARQWPVGSFVEVVKRARAELTRRGLTVAHDVLSCLPTDDSLAIEAVIAYLKSVQELDGLPVHLAMMLATEDSARKRQGCYVIAAAGLKVAIPEMRKLLTDADEQVARYASFQLATLGDGTVIPLLIQRYSSADVTEMTQRYIIDALSKIPDPLLIHFYIDACGHKSVIIRRIAQNVLLPYADSSVQEIMNVIPSAPIQQKRCLLEALGRIATAKALDFLLLYTADSDPWVRLTVFISFGHAKRAGKLRKVDTALLTKLLETEPDDFCRMELCRVLDEKMEWKREKP